MLPTLQAEQQLRAIDASMAPWMSAAGRRDMVRGYERMLGAEGKAKPATRADLAAIGITVETVDAEGVPVGDGTSRDEMEARP